ncbi:hypothetical protein J7F03_24660 [Streptomyces sp. ISL-43]|uniref:hypothetical protein n=1 Tax=Streptomyces sp. ISL-43 TaxID=2819183 RepID=UPI001BEB3D85|nr:hypothetical protein [Streptomyces sp. ISL-43]MBT2450209.1 hypothetical protein [Streptomyces sp. ISL-43]
MTVSATMLVLLLSGCSDAGDGGGGGGKEPAAEAVRIQLESKDLVFPLAAYLPTPQQHAVLDVAQDVLIDQCMKRYGLRYDQRRKADPAATSDGALRYGVSSEADATRYGYANPRLVKDKPAQPPMGPNERLILAGPEADMSKPGPKSQEEAEKSAEGTSTVAGQTVPAGGCLGESARKLHTPTDDTVDNMAVQGFGLDSFARSREDSRIRAVLGQWSARMAKQGHKVDDPVKAPSQLGLKPADLNGPRAIAAAQQDVACKKETNLVGVWFSVETAYQKRVIEQNAEMLDLAKKQHEERMRLAATLTGSGA